MERIAVKRGCIDGFSMSRNLIPVLRKLPLPRRFEGTCIAEIR